MADPVGVVGTAAGLISLSLQLCSAISAYFDALESRQDDLASTRAQLETLRRSATIVEAALPQLEASLHQKADALLPALISCKAGLDQLEAFLQELVDSPTPVSTLKGRIKMLAFPFHRPSLMKLEDRLQKTNSAFHTALCVLNLSSSIALETTLSSIEACTNQLPQIESKVSRLSTSVCDVTTSMGHMSCRIDSAATAARTSNFTTTNLASNFDAFALTTSSQLSNIQQSINGVAHQSNGAEITTVMASNATSLQNLDAGMQQMAAATNHNLPQILLRLASIDQSLEHLKFKQTLCIEGSGEQRSGQATLRRLLAKPSQTRELYDRFFPTDASAASRTNLGVQSSRELALEKPYLYTCSCLRRKTRVASSSRFGLFQWRTEKVVRQHSPECRYSMLSVGETSRRFQITGVASNSILSLGLEFSLAITRGAGGLSISPQLVCLNVVDRRASPVFQIVSLMANYLEFAWHRHLDDTQAYHYVQLGLKMILQLYHDRKASPYDIDGTGASIFHYWAFTFANTHYRRNQRTIAHSFVKQLMQLGVPAGISDFYGDTPAAVLASFLLWPPPGEQLNVVGLRLLYEAAPESVVRWAPFAPTRGPSPDGRLHAAISDCGPLSTAILTGDRETIFRELKTKSALHEINSLGQTPLHLAISVTNPTLLQTLLHASNESVLHACDKNGRHILEYGIPQSSIWCQNGEAWVECSGCTCSDALDYLLSIDNFFETWFGVICDKYISHIAAGIENTNAAISWSMRWLLDALREASHAWRLRLFAKVINIREQLKVFARTRLCEEDIRAFGLSTDFVLDLNAADVVESLQTAGFEVPKSLRVGIGSRESIYHKIMCSEIAQLSYDLGFRSLNKPNSYGATPLLEVLLEMPVTNYVLWLLDHGADITTLVSNINLKQRNYRSGYSVNCNSSLTAGHLTFRCGFRWFSEGRAESLRTLIMRVSSYLLSDHCICLCSENGCTPESLLFVNFWKNDYGRWWNRGQDDNLDWWVTERKPVLDSIVYWLSKFFNQVINDPAKYRILHLSALRVLTFEALELTHTCCKGYEPWASSDEIEEIWSEEKDAIDLFELLKAEFETDFSQQGLPFDIFLTTRWLPRMKEVHAELEAKRMSEEEVAAARQLGVTWDTENSSDDEEADYSKNECWIRRMADIAEEYGVSSSNFHASGFTDT